MDTLISARKIELSYRCLEQAVTVLLFVVLVLSHFVFLPPMYANDLIANTSAATTPTLYQAGEILRENLSPVYRNEIFERSMRSKYSGWKVNHVADGIKHIKMVKYYNGKPVKINVVEINPKVAQDFEIMPATASSNSLNHKSSIRNMAQRTNSIVAINGGFFKPQSGIPLGTLMINGKLFTGPIYNRVALGIFDNGFDVARIEFNGKITGNNTEIKIDNINQPRMLSSYVLVYTRDWGSYAPASPRDGVQLQIVDNKITAASANPLFIPENGFVLVGPKEKLSALFGSAKVDVEISLNPKWDNVKHIISGGPYLVKNGNVYVDVSEEKLLSIGGRNPRSAVGYTSANNLIIVAVDGREGSSVGLTLYELAQFMKSLGCENAINLDGGGSTVMYVNGQIVNSPPQTGGIALSNAIVVSKKTIE